jgi:hypothetical protein
VPILTGKVSPWGPTVNIKAMQTNQRVEALKRAGQNFSSPMVVLGLMDTGASVSALDTQIVSSLGLAPRDIILIHTPPTGAACEKRISYDALFIAGKDTNDPLSKTIDVIGCELASQGFFALLGRNFLEACRFVYVGPDKSFSLQYGPPWRPTSFTASLSP